MSAWRGQEEMNGFYTRTAGLLRSGIFMPPCSLLVLAGLSREPLEVFNFMALWIKSDQSLLNHPKLLKLKTESKIELDTTIGRLHRLWWWCLDYAFDGDLRKFDASMIESACDLSLSDLISSGFVDYRPYRRIHNWWHHAGRYLQIKYKDQPHKWRQIEKQYSPMFTDTVTTTVTTTATHRRGRRGDKREREEDVDKTIPSNSTDFVSQSSEEEKKRQDEAELQKIKESVKLGYIKMPHSNI